MKINTKILSTHCLAFVYISLPLFTSLYIQSYLSIADTWLWRTLFLRPDRIPIFSIVQSLYIADTSIADTWL